MYEKPANFVTPRDNADIPQPAHSRRRGSEHFLQALRGTG